MPLGLFRLGLKMLWARWASQHRGHPATWHCTGYRAQGNYAEAEPFYRRSLAIREKVLGPEHPDVAQSLNNLALLYHDQGHYVLAAPLYRRSLTIWEKALGPEHPNVAQSLENYAALLRNTGRPKKAAEMEARAKVIRAKYE